MSTAVFCGCVANSGRTVRCTCKAEVTKNVILRCPLPNKARRDKLPTSTERKDDVTGKITETMATKIFGLLYEKEGSLAILTLTKSWVSDRKRERESNSGRDEHCSREKGGWEKQEQLRSMRGSSG